FLPDGKTLVLAEQLDATVVWKPSAGRVHVRLWDAAARKESTPPAAGHEMKISSWVAAMSPNGNVLLNVASDEAPKYAFELWERTTGKLIGKLEGSVTWTK